MKAKKRKEKKRKEKKRKEKKKKRKKKRYLFILNENEVHFKKKYKAEIIKN